MLHTRSTEDKVSLGMAKYTRHDNRNRKRNKHKNQTKFDGGYKMKGEDYNRSRLKRDVLQLQ